MKGIFYLLLLITSLLWGGNFVAGKFLVGHATPLTLTVLRWVIALLCLLPIVWIKERKLLPDRRALFPLLLMGLTGVALFNVFLYLSLERTTAYNAGLLSALNPVAIAIVSFFLLKEKLTAIQMGGMALSFIGVAVVISKGDWQRIVEFSFNTGDIFMLLAVFIWALYSFAVKKAMQFTSPYMSTLWAGIFGVGILLPFNLGSFELVNTNTAFWIAVLYTSLGATVAAMILWNIGVQKVGGTKSGIFLNFNPIFTAILAFLFLGEVITIYQLFGTILVICGVFLFNIIGSSKAKAQPQPLIKAEQNPIKLVK